MVKETTGKWLLGVCMALMCTVVSYAQAGGPGSVNLPAAGRGYRANETATIYPNEVGKTGSYWSSTSRATTTTATARRLAFGYITIYSPVTTTIPTVAVSDNPINKTLNYFPVRLVRDIE